MANFVITCDDVLVPSIDSVCGGTRGSRCKEIILKTEAIPGLGREGDHVKSWKA